MRGSTEVKEIKEVNEKRGEIAAFFDLDGTLMAGPSMERRFFRMLRYRREIGVRNCFLWLREAVRLMPRGIREMLQANKMYLRGVQSFHEREARGNGISSGQKGGGHKAERQEVGRSRGNPRLPVPAFFAEAIERVAWHAGQGHAAVIVSGTLEPLAEEARRSLEAQLEARGLATRIRVCATRLEARNGRWTGKILGDAMFGEAKARALKQLADEMQFDLGRCFAYGDSANDRWLMEAVGWPAAVNPSKSLAGISRMHGWPILDWNRKENLTRRRRVR